VEGRLSGPIRHRAYRAGPNVGVASVPSLLRLSFHRTCPVVHKVRQLTLLQLIHSGDELAGVAALHHY
jgi:hypothetical protein